jgi:uncharacterized protein
MRAVSKPIRILLIIAGSLSLGLAVVGIVLPLLPTTPFLLLSAACYLRSSNRLYRWLINHPWFGSYLKNYMEGKGMPIKAKVITLVILWGVILLSVFVVAHALWLQLVLVGVAIGVSIYLFLMKTYHPIRSVENKSAKNNSEWDDSTL